MTKDEARALDELLRDLQQRVNRLKEALELGTPVPIEREWLSVGERLAALEIDGD
jgi:hypothetical protein